MDRTVSRRHFTERQQYKLNTANEYKQFHAEVSARSNEALSNYTPPMVDIRRHNLPNYGSVHILELILIALSKYSLKYALNMTSIFERIILVTTPKVSYSIVSVCLATIKLLKKGYGICQHSYIKKCYDEVVLANLMSNSLATDGRKEYIFGTQSNSSLLK